MILQALAPDYAGLSAHHAQSFFPARDRSFVRTGQQVGFVQLIGVLTKAELVDARAEVNRLAADELIGEILVLVDSPGGTVSGTNDLFLAISRAAERKRVIAFVEDLGASAAYWAIAGATEIVVNPTGLTGSIGVFVVVVDASRAFEAAGVDVIVIRSGTGKGAGVSGAKISPEQLAQLQERVNEQARHFVAAIARGRRMSSAKAQALADGRTFVGSQSVAAGLVDRVAVLEDVVLEIAERTQDFALNLLMGRDALAKFNALVAAESRGEYYLRDSAQRAVSEKYPGLADAAEKQREVDRTESMERQKRSDNW